MDMNLIDQLPIFYKNSPEFVELMAAIQTETDIFNKYAAELPLQLRIETATWGLAYWEKHLGLPTDLSEDIEQRRTKVLAKQNARNTATLERVKILCETYAPIAEILEDNQNCIILIKINGNVRTPIEYMQRELEKYIPSHIKASYVFSRILVSDIQGIKISKLKQLTVGNIIKEG